MLGAAATVTPLRGNGSATFTNYAREPIVHNVAITGDDPMAKSSTLASQSEFAFIDNEMPVLVAGDMNVGK